MTEAGEALPPGLARYLDSGVGSVEGWLSPTTAEIVARLLARQTQAGLRGDVCEIGVHHGKFFLVLANATLPGERAVAVDVFSDQHKNIDQSGHGDRSIFERHLAHHAETANVDIIQESSLDLEPTGFLSRRFRFISIDGGHTASAVLNDLRLAERTLLPGGVAALDDLLSHNWTGVLTGLVRYLAEGGTLVPFALPPNKLLLTTGAAFAEQSRRLLRQDHACVLAKPDLEFLGVSIDSYDERAAEVPALEQVPKRVPEQPRLRHDAPVRNSSRQMPGRRKARSVVRSLALRVPAIARLFADHQRLVTENQRLKESAWQTAPISASRIGRLCGVVDPMHYLDAEWLGLHHDLEAYSIDKHCFQNVGGEIYRKGWEWTHCVFGLRRLGMLATGHRALGVGVGRECVIFYLADHVASVTATDLYGEAGWSDARGREADLALLEEAKRHCPPGTDLSKIVFETQDGTALGYAPDSFDFAWSLSSIEHFGNHAAAQKAISEMARVVRPGGVVAVATEMLLLEEYAHPEYFTPSQVINELVVPFANLALVDPVDFRTLPYEYLVDSIVVPAAVDRRRRHVVLNDGKVQWTSVMLFFRVLA